MREQSGVNRGDETSDLTSRVHATIRDQILDHRLQPGQRITISSLAAELGASPTPVREALAMLASSELVTREHNRGYRVNDVPSQRELADLYDFRFLIEPWAAGRAAARVSPTQVRLLDRELDRFEASLEGQAAAAGSLAEHDDRFHRMIFDIADNDHGAKAYQRCQVHLHLFRLSIETSHTPLTLAEHRAIATAIAATDAQAAHQAMLDHLTNSHERMFPQGR